MKKTLAVLALGAALSIFSQKIYASDPKIFSYANNENNKQDEEIFSNLFNTFSMISEPNFEKKWNMHEGLEFDIKIKFDYNFQINPIKFNPISVCVNFLLQYNF